MSSWSGVWVRRTRGAFIESRISRMATDDGYPATTAHAWDMLVNLRLTSLADTDCFPQAIWHRFERRAASHTPSFVRQSWIEPGVQFSACRCRASQPAQPGTPGCADRSNSSRGQDRDLRWLGRADGGAVQQERRHPCTTCGPRECRCSRSGVFRCCSRARAQRRSSRDTTLPCSRHLRDCVRSHRA